MNFDQKTWKSKITQTYRTSIEVILSDLMLLIPLILNHYGQKRELKE